jgi:hypothetical protein
MDIVVGALAKTVLLEADGLALLVWDTNNHAVRFQPVIFREFAAVLPRVTVVDLPSTIITHLSPTGVYCHEQGCPSRGCADLPEPFVLKI